MSPTRARGAIEAVGLKTSAGKRRGLRPLDSLAAKLLFICLRFFILERHPSFLTDMTDHKFRETFDQVRKEFFPRWDRQRHWRARIARKLNGSVGHCDFTSRVIEAFQVPDDDDELAALLIHEIAHAATASYHAKRWITRMERAAQQAKAIRRSRLARLIREEIHGYGETP